MSKRESLNGLTICTRNCQLVRIQGFKRTVVMHDFIDNRSDITLIERDVARQLRMLRSRATLNISIVNESSSINQKDSS